LRIVAARFLLIVLIRTSPICTLFPYTTLFRSQDLALEGVLVGDVGAGCDDRLGDVRHRLDDLDAEPGGIDTDIAPGEPCMAFGMDEMLKMLDRDRARLSSHRKEAHRDGIAALGRQFDAA